MRVQSDHVWLVFTSYDTEQVFTNNDVKEMREKYNVIFDPKGCFALRIIPSKSGDRNPIFQITAEDDGCIKFFNDPNPHSGFLFDSGWAENIIDLIQKAMDFCDGQEDEEKEE